VSDDLSLMQEVEARRRLHGRRIRMLLLAPYGSSTGCGKLRVLRVTMNDESPDAEVEMTVGYEAYLP
jgi:hypothetical protein